jgi:formylglycine-generating enzyme required for sulfatase activity
MNMKNKYCFGLIMGVSLWGSLLFVASCGKDPAYVQGDYIYENDDFTRVDIVNGFIIHWADDVEITEEQKTVILNLIANLVRVEGGTFMMGAQHSNTEGAHYDPEAADNESPVHQVTLSDYYIGKYEVTQREWYAVMGYDLDWPEQYGKGDSIPVYNVSRTDALRFLEKLSALTRLSFQLPSEAQWEYAARGGSYSQHYHYSGSDDVDDVAWHNGNAGGILHSVGEKQPNELGLYDMSGNVWEWCLDTYGPYSSLALENPVSMSGDLFVLRGGSWAYLPGYSRVTCRDSYDGNASSVSVGFRVSLINN